MNERIKQLAKQAGAELYEGFAGSPNSIKFAENDFEKFAELIVQECIEQIQISTPRDPQVTTQYRQSIGHVDKIRKHFGILMNQTSDESFALYPYTKLPAKTVRVRLMNDDGQMVSMTKWYDIDTGKELPPYYGYGKEADKLIKEWCDEQDRKEV